MSQNYYNVITNKGLIKHASSISSGVKLDLKYIVVGSGYENDPESADEQLQNFEYQSELTYVGIDKNNPNQLIIEGVVDEIAGPFYIREVGILDSDGDLFAIGKYPETFKPESEANSGKRLYIRMVIAFVSSPHIQVLVSDNINFSLNFESDLGERLDDVDDEINDRLQISQNLADLNDAAVARSNLGLHESSNSDLTGIVSAFAFNFSPEGWLECDGSAISRSTYVGLFAKIGEIHGAGDGATTFNLPDLRGEFVRGWDNGRNVDVGRGFGSFQADEFKSHSHQIRSNATDGNAGTAAPYSSRANFSYTNIDDILSTGGSETRPRNIALIYCIKY
jgi:phage-related tail fiber protein